MLRIAPWLVVALFLQSAPAQPLLSNAARAAADRITADQLSKDLNFLSSDELLGRNTPSPGFDKAAAYIVERLQRAGVKPLGDDGTFYQRYVMRESRVDTENAVFEAAGKPFRSPDGFSLRSFAAPVSGTYPVVYIQHGWTMASRGIDPFAGVDVKGKVVVAHGPRANPKGIEVRQIGRINVDAVSALDEARRRGAVALLYIPQGDVPQGRGGGATMTRKELEPPVPSAYAAPALTSALLSRAAADALFDGERITASELLRLGETSDYPAPFQLQKQITLRIPTSSSVDHRPYNVVAVIEGSDPVLRNEYITIESHLDGAVGTREVNGDRIYNSADDNATGSAGTLSIAEQIVKLGPKRSLIFIWDSGEEQGLWGTRHFVGNPPVPLDRIVAHFNIDMIGATRAPGTADADSKEASGPNEVFLAGPGVLSKGVDAILERVNAEYLKMTFDRTYDKGDAQFFYPRTDAGPFLERGILTINFFTGLHPRYHQPADEAKYLDVKKMEAVTKTVFASVWALANVPERPRIDQPMPPTVPNYRTPQGSPGAVVSLPTTILRNGTVIDGSGLPPYRADVLIRGDRVAKVGDLRREKADREIDVTGLYVAPGFINIHSHASVAALARAENMLTQGVTTEILNADGSGAVDLSAQRTRFGDALALNVGTYIGFNSVWSSVVGADDRRPTPEEIERMRGLIVEGMKAGAWGVSAGLDYKPAYFATTDEVIRVVSAAAPWRTNFTNHDRVTPESGFSSYTGIEETLKIAEAAGLVGVVTHMKVTGKERGTARRHVTSIADATRRGHYAAADAYPYLAGATGLGALIVPAWAQDGGRPAMLKRFADPQQRQRIATEAEQIIAARFGDASSIYLPATQRQLTDVMAQMQVGAGEAVIRLLEESSPGAIIRFGLEDDLRAILRFRETSIACDCGATTATATHPRNYGSYPRVLGKYVREDKVLTWQDAVRKMTALPAATIGMVDRGYVAPGMAADIAVFDPKTIIDRATYESSALLSEGIRHVFVNGVHALRDGAVTGEQGGRTLVRSDGMPSRPMTGTRDRALNLHAHGAGGQELMLEIVQPAGERHARAKVILREDGRRVQAGAIGILQVAPGWATITTEHMRVVVDTDKTVRIWRGDAPPLTLTATAVRIVPRSR